MPGVIISVNAASRNDLGNDKQITRFDVHGIRIAYLWVPAYPRARADDVEGIDWVRGHVREDDVLFKAAMAARALRS